MKDNPELAVKIFKDELDADALAAMVASPVTSSRPGYEIFNPLDIALEKRDGKAVGCLLKVVKEAVDTKLIYRAATWLPKPFLIRFRE